MNVTSNQQLANLSYLEQSRIDFSQRQAGPLTSIGAELIGIYHRSIDQPKMTHCP